MLKTFYITSYGRTATYWLTSLLNAHPDIYCTHGPTFERLEGGANEPSMEHTAQALRDQGVFYDLSLREIAERMQQRHPQAAMVGNVHAFTAARLDKKLTSEKKYPYPLQRINLLRHPATRADSYAAQWVRQANADAAMAKHFEEAMDANAGYHSIKNLALKHYPVDFSLRENRMFVYALIMLGNDLSDTGIDCKHIAYERLVSDIEYFQWFFHTITAGTLKLTDGVLAAFRTSSLKNTSNTYMKTSRETLRNWEPWKIFLLRFTLEKTPKMAALYRRFDYDIDSLFETPPER